MEKKKDSQLSEKSVGQFLLQQKKKINSLLPKSLPADKLLRIIMNEVNRTPRLLQCSEASIVGAILKCAQLGLEPGPMDWVYLVPYKNECQCIIGYKGLLELAYRSGYLIYSNARVVCENDYFSYSFGTKEYIQHRYHEVERGEIIGAYAVLTLKNGMKVMDYMTTQNINSHRDRSPTYSYWLREGGKGHAPPWVTDYGPMGIKTVLRVLLKIQRMSQNVYEAIAYDEKAEIGSQENGLIFDIEPENEITKVNSNEELENSIVIPTQKN